MTEEVLRWIRKEELIEAGNHVIVGVSGGADSVCLLFLLKELREILNISLEAVHVEHGIRGTESVEDAKFTKELCEKAGIPCRTFTVDAPAYAKARGIGLEEAARTLRYRCYEDAAKTSRVAGQSVRVALAHHADDNAETALFQLIRGSGIDGLCGMRPKRLLSEQAILIRPLLGVRRCEIEAYLEKKGQVYRTDGTNTDMTYSRNRIRHEIMPALGQLNRQAVRHVNRSAEELREIADFLRGQTERIRPLVAEELREKGEILLNVRLLEYPKVLQREVIHDAIVSVAGSSKDIGSVHVEAVRKLFDSQTGKSIRLPYRLTAERTYQGVCMVPAREEERREDESVCLTDEQTRLLEEGKTIAAEITGGRILFKIQKFSGKSEEIVKNKYTKWFDYDTIKDRLQVRRRKSGDYLVIDDAGHRKKIKDYLVAEKIPAKKRQNLWLLAEGAHILWVIGGRISAHYKVKADTKRVLEVTAIGEYE